MMKPAATPHQSKHLHLRHHRSKDGEHRRSSDPGISRPQKITARCLDKELNSEEVTISSPIVKCSDPEEQIRSGTCVTSDFREGSAVDPRVLSPISLSTAAKQGEVLTSVVIPEEVVEGQREGKGVNLELDNSSRKVLDNLHDIVFGILEHDHGVEGGGRGELQRLIRRRKVHIAFRSFVFVFGLVLLVLVFAEDSSTVTFTLESTPT